MTTHKFLIPLLLVVGLISCHDKKSNSNEQIQMADLAQWRVANYALCDEEIRREIDALRLRPAKMYADSYARNYYASRQPYLWITRSGIDHRADTLLKHLEQAIAEGIPASCFRIAEIRACLQSIRQLDFEEDRQDINTCYGKAEFLLTQAYLRYTCGQRFGYLRPDVAFNRLDHADASGDSPFVRLYDIDTERADEAFTKEALDALRNESFSDFLQKVQPTSPLHKRFAEAFQCASDEKMRRKAMANLERSRWRTLCPEGRHVWVNLASGTLLAAGGDESETFDMKICFGSRRHKTPMLHSKIERIDLNPYWNIPYSIIKREIAPLHAGDAAYFARNRYRIFSKETGEEMNPAHVTAAMLTSGRYRVRQDNGEGNSLGRLIFRFPNDFSIYLHDTNNRAAFARKNRAISHGCVRVEKPYELALFLLQDPDEKTVEKLQEAIGMLPDEKGSGTHSTDEEEKKPKFKLYRLETPVPVFIEYYTLYPDGDKGCTEYPDPYGYDDVLLKNLEAL